MNGSNSSVSFLQLAAAFACGIALTLFLLKPGAPGRSATDPHPTGEATEERQLWTCAMHPHILEDDPGLCPICNMNLTPVQGSDAAPVDRSTPREVELAPPLVQAMNVRTTTVTRQDLSHPIRTVGSLDYDQERMVTVTTKYSGWIEKVYVNYVGESVRRGQPLFEIYSPELVQTEQELLSALRFAAAMQDAPTDARERAESLVESARVRLSYWDVSPQQIAELEATGEVFRTLTVAAPRAGLVMKRLPGLEGMAVRPGLELFHLADLSSLWLSAELFEDQVAWVQPGAEARVELSYFPGESFLGTVRFLEPALSETTRTARALIEIPNPDGRLRKGMYATVSLDPTRVADAIAVPLSAVLRTGRRDVVVIARGEGRFEPRTVVLGHQAGEWIEIRSGLAAGEEIVTSAQFLIDSESTLREAVDRMLEQRQSEAPPTPTTGRTNHQAHQPGS